MAGRSYTSDEMQKLRQYVEELGPSKGCSRFAQESHRTVSGVTFKYYNSVAKHITMPAKKHIVINPTPLSAFTTEELLDEFFRRNVDLEEERRRYNELRRIQKANKIAELEAQINKLQLEIDSLS